MRQMTVPSESPSEREASKAPPSTASASNGNGRRKFSLFSKIDEISTNNKARKAWLTFAIAVFVAVIVIPAIFVITKIFTDWASVKAIIDNEIWMDIITGAVFNSFSIALIVTIIDIIVGLPMAWLMVRRDFKGKKWLDTLLDIPLAFPTAVLGISVVMLWGAPEGVAIPGLGLVVSPYIMMIMLHFLFTYPYMVRSLSGILEQIDPNYDIAAMTLGASKWTAARTISIPLFRAGLATGFILCFARSLSETGGTYIGLTMMGAVTQDGGDLLTNMENGFFTGPAFISFIKNSIGKDSPEAMGAMILISIVMIVFALLLLLVAKRIINRFHIPVKKVWPEIGRMVSRGFLPKAKDLVTIGFLVCIILLPAFYIFTYLTQPMPNLDYGSLLSSIGVSVLVAGVAVVVDLVLGIPMALYIARNRGKKIAGILDELVNVPLIIPTTALGFSLGLFWHSIFSGASMDLLLVILGHISFTYPLVVRNMIGAIEEVNPECEEIAMTLGAKPFQAFRNILVPIIKSSVIAGCILAFTRSIGETGATTSIVTGDLMTVPVYITNLVKDHAYTEAAYCSIILIFICFALLMVVRFVSNKKRGRDA